MYRRSAHLLVDELNNTKITVKMFFNNCFECQKCYGQKPLVVIELQIMVLATANAARNQAY